MVKNSCFSQKVHNPFINEHLFPLLFVVVDIRHFLQVSAAKTWLGMGCVGCVAGGGSCEGDVMGVLVGIVRGYGGFVSGA